jgi:tetratricopeptide (TPR) repeat protein/tRNA A-37 threonylcarbamoyl transferase component Bud32
MSVVFLLIGIAAHAQPVKEKPKLTPEQAEIVGEFSSELQKIPQELYGNDEKLQNFIKADPDLGQLQGDEKFNSAVRIMAGLGAQRDESQRGGGDRREGGDREDAARGRREDNYYRFLVKAVKNQPWLFFENGKRSYARKDYKAAFQDYEEGLRLDPEDKEALLGYGHSSNELGDTRLALMAAERLLKRYPKDKDALGLYYFAKDRAPTVNLPSTIFQGGSPEPESLAGDSTPRAPSPERTMAAKRAAAVTAVPEAVTRSSQLTREAGTALGVRDYPAAQHLAGKAIALNAGNAQAFNLRAIAFNRMSRFSEAVSDANEALKLVPGNAAALQIRSWAFAKQGNYQEALRDADETLLRDASNAYAYQNKAMALAGLNDRPGALEALRRSAAIDPRFKDRYDRALQFPQDQDLALLFDDDGADAVQPPPPAQLRRRFVRLAGLTALGGILIALGILHVVSASWREKVRVTIRRVLSSSSSSAAPSMPVGGSPFWAQYEVVKEIGLGGMGVVYEAKDRSLERRVAVKKMRNEIRVDPRERGRFVNEARLVAKLRHQNIVDIYAIAEDGDDVYLVFEYVDGRTLQDQIKSDGPMSLEAARGVLRATAEAVEHAHSQHIVHRDLKPSNIMITSEGRVKVMDFGVARQAKDMITKMSMTNTVVGTPAYMAPEQEQGTVCPESDVYSLGVCLYEMLTGHLPFAGSAGVVLMNKMNGKLVAITQRNAALPAGLDAVIEKALAPNPERRYHTPTQLLAALDAVRA